jgi:hypothetical protein
MTWPRRRCNSAAPRPWQPARPQGPAPLPCTPAPYPRLGNTKGVIRDTPCRGNDLSTPVHDRRVRNLCVQNLELEITDRLLALGSIPGTSGEALNNANAHSTQQLHVHLAREAVVDQYIVPHSVRAKRSHPTTARISQLYMVCRNWLILWHSHAGEATPVSIFSASPRSSGSEIIVSLFFLLSISANHYKLLVSTTVSENAMTGSATLTSTSLDMLRRSGMTQSRPSSLVPMITCNPRSS